MSRNKDKYAGLRAVQKNDLYRLTPNQWKAHLSQLNIRTMKKLYKQMNTRGGSEWERVKELFIEAMLQKQQESMSKNDQEVK